MAELIAGAAPQPDWKISLRRAKISFAWAAGTCAATILLAVSGPGQTVRTAQIAALVGVLAATVMFGWAFVRALIALGRMSMAKERVRGRDWFAAIALGLVPLAGLLFGAAIAFIGTMGMSRGRQLRRRGKVLLPPLTPDDAWSGDGGAVGVPEGVRDALAARWRENGRTEHASVAAFARLTLDLMALGAPPELIHSANRDALDEIRHTERCFALAKSIDGRDIGPGAFPEAQDARTLPKNRTLALAQLAVDSLIDGALHEGLSARVLSRLQSRVEVPDIRAVVRELALDESRHAAHGWDAVEWCLAEGGTAVAFALRGAVEALSESHETDLPPAARDGAWEPLGVHGEALETDEYAGALRSLRDRVDALTSRAAVAAQME